MSENERPHVAGAWCDIQGTYNNQVQLLLCAAPYTSIAISDEGDDCLASKSNYGLDQLDDLRVCLNEYFDDPGVQAELTWIQEGTQ